ncbi:hypothetical protein [Streptosporangium sp. NPDC049046]|uniref:hypothetical protein n=1 Tax=unclassified Streptosporangium TaxID=2632669 RepID=UPI0034493F66
MHANQCWDDSIWPLMRGDVIVDGEDLWRLTSRRAAQLIAALRPETYFDFDVTV